MEGCCLFLVDLLFYDFYLLNIYFLWFKTTDFPLYFYIDLEFLDLEFDFLPFEAEDLSFDAFLTFFMGALTRLVK